MANTRSSQVDTPAFDAQGSSQGSVLGVPDVGDPADAAVSRVADQLGGQASAFADTQAQSEGKTAGAVAGLDPDWRPTVDPTIRGQAFNAAAQDTYVNNLQTQTRGAIFDAYNNYMELPVDQRQPSVLKTSLDGIQQQFEQDHVFPSILPSFRKQFADQAFTYLDKAQTDLDTQTQDQSKASFLANAQSASDSAMRAASLATPLGDAQALKEKQAHDNLVDEQVKQGVVTAVQGETIKQQFTQNLSQTAIMAKFNSLAPADQPAFLANFKKSYGTGLGTTAPAKSADDDDDDDTPAASTSNAALYAQQEQAKGLPTDYLGRVAQIESGGHADRKNSTSGALGLFQFMPGTAAQYGLADPTDPATSTAAAAQLTADNAATLRKGLGREPTAPELYLAHQQGAGGALKLLQNPDASATSLLGLKAVTGNSGTTDMTAAQFATVQENKFNGTPGNPTNGLSNDTFQTLAGTMQSTITRNIALGQEASRKGIAEIQGVQKQIEGGIDVPQPEWSALQSKYVANPDPAVQQQLAETGQIRATLTGFRGQTPQAIDASIANTQAGIAQNGATPVQAGVLKAAQGYLAKYRSDLDSDPLDRAAKEGAISGVAPIDFSQPANVAAGLAARAPQAQQAASYFGRPTTYLLPDEAAQLKKIAATGGQPMIDAARATVAALGPNADAVFKQVSGDAPAFATAGRIAAWNGSPSFLTDFAQRQQLATNPATSKALELPPQTMADDQAKAVLGTSLSAIPEMDAAVRQAARQVFEVRALNGNLDPKVADAASQASYTRGVQEATGATFDGTQQYGGVGTYSPSGLWSGSQKVLAPLGMQADKVGDAIGALRAPDYQAMAQPPVAGDLKTAISPSAIRGASLTSVGHGQYRVSLGDPGSADPHWVMQPNGSPFTLDLNALEPVLRQRVPQIYRPGS